MTRSPGGRAWVLPWAGLAALAVVRAGVVDERDPYWQVRAGLENLEGAALSRPDAWSWDPVDRAFTQTSPAWNDALGLGWRTAGFAGFFVVGLLSMLLYLAVVLALSRRLGARPLPTLAGVLAVLLVALPMLSPRATLVAQTLVLAAVLATDRLRPTLARTAPPVLAATGLAAGFLVAWAGSWLHLSWLLLAPALWLCVAALVLTTPGVGPGRRAAVLVGTGAGLALGVLAGPYGTDAVALTRTVQEAAGGSVLEWMSPFTAGLAARWVPTAALALGGAGLGVRWLARHRRDRDRDPRVGLVAALLVLAVPTALAGLVGIRFLGVSLLALAPLAALGASALADRVHHRAAQDPPTGPWRHARVRAWSEGRPWSVVLTLVLVLVSPLVLLAGARLGRPPEAAALDALPRGCRLVSDPASAGTVLLLRPDVRVWIDTRADYWGRERNRTALEVLSGADTAVPAVAGATCALLAASPDLPTGGLAAALDADPSWTARATTGGTRVWVRTGGAGQAP